MAEVRPSAFPKKTAMYRAAERGVFDKCSALPDGWFALYSVPWVDRESVGSSPIGEADFVFVGPDIGLVVVEVKGGGISRAEDGSWYSQDRNGHRHKLKHPAIQAQENLFAIRRYLDSNNLSTIFSGIPTTSMVCFPQIEKTSLPPLPELPMLLILDERDLNTLADSIRLAVDAMNPNHRKTLAGGDCKVLADALMPSFATPGRWSSWIWDQKYAVDRLTDEQIRFLNALQDNRSIALTGPAGCGKTIAALHCGKQFLQRGGSLLVITPNKALREYYKLSLGNERATITLDLSASDVLSQEWNCIIVDEAQDINPQVLEHVIRYERSPSFKLFLHDSNQRLGRGILSFGSHCMTARFDKVLRNTKEIGTFSTKFYLNASLSPLVVGPTGCPVREIAIDSNEDLPQRVSAFIQTMVDDEGFRYRDIVVLFGRSRGKVLRSGGQSFGGVSFRNAADVWPENCDDSKCIACCDILAFRGLESPVVILCEIDQLIEQELVEACYVGTSRAQFVLAIAGSPGTLERIRSLDLAPVVAQRVREKKREQQRQSTAMNLSRQVSVGFTCLAKVTGVKPWGVWCHLPGTGCDGFLHRSKVTSDKLVDLEGLFTKGKVIGVRVATIEEVSGKVHLELVDYEAGVLRRTTRK